jgi:hypothetical protein
LTFVEKVLKNAIRRTNRRLEIRYHVTRPVKIQNNKEFRGPRAMQLREFERKHQILLSRGEEGDYIVYAATDKALERVFRELQKWQ